MLSFLKINIYLFFRDKICDVQQVIPGGLLQNEFEEARSQMEARLREFLAK